MVDIQSVPPAILAGITLYIGVYCLMVRGRRPRRSGALIFALGCLSMGLYDVFGAGLYSAATPLQGFQWQRLRLVCLGLFGIAFPWSVVRFFTRTWPRSRVWKSVLIGFSAFFALSALPVMLNLGSLYWRLDQPAVKHVQLPFGGTVVYQEVAPGALTYVQDGMAVLVCLYILGAVLHKSRRESRRQSLVLLLAIPVLIVALVSDTAVSAGLYPFFYITEYAFIGAALLMAYVFSGRLVEAPADQGCVQESREQFRSFLDTTSDWVWEVDRDFVFTYSSSQVRELLGFEVEEIIGRTPFDLMSPEQALQVGVVVDEGMAARRPLERMESLYLHRNGQPVVVETNAVPVLDAEGDFLGYRGTTRDITDSVRRHETVRRERDLLGQIIRTSPSGILLVDGEGRILFANARAEALLGLTRSTVDVGTYDPPEWRVTDYAGRPLPEEALPWVRVMRSGRPVYGLHQAIEWPDGRRVLLSVSGAPLSDQSGRVDGMVATIEDVSEQVKASEALQASEQKHRRLFEDSPISLWEEDFTAAKAYLDHLGEQGIQDFGPHLKAHPEIVAQCAQLVEVVNVNRATMELYGLKSRADLLGPLAKTLGLDAYDAFREELVAVAADQTWFESDTITETIAGEKKNTIVRWSVVPGLEEPWSCVLVSAVDITELKRVEEALLKRTAQLETLRQVSLELSAQLDVTVLLRSIASRGVELLGGIGGALSLYRVDRDVLELRITVGRGLPRLGTVLHRNEGLAGKVWVTGQPMIVDDYWHWEGRTPAHDGLPNVAAVGVPVRWGDEFMGVLSILADVPHTFSAGDAELLVLLAAQAASAIRNARLLDDARRRAQRLAVVNHITRAGSTLLQLDDLLETVYDRVTTIFPADAFFIALYDEQTYELEFCLQVDEGLRQAPERLPVGTGLTSVVVSRREPLLIRDLEQEQDGLPTPSLWGTMRLPLSWLGVPMLIGDRLVGVMCVQSYDRYAYDEEDQLLLSTIADQVAVAVERARLHQVLRDSEEKYRTLFEQANDAVFLETADGHILDANERACQLLGYDREELLRLTVADIVPAAIRGGLPQLVQDVRQSVRTEVAYVRRDGTRVEVEVSKALLEVGEQPVVLALVHDITGRKRLEGQLRHAQKMEAIGTLAGGIAHDFNNILTGILGYASLLCQEVPPEDPMRSDLDAIVQSAERAASLTDQLLTFARRREQFEMGRCDVNAIVREVVNLLERTIDKAITIQMHLADDLHTVLGDGGQLHQVALNLCLNARDAMPDGGQLLIETSNTQVSREEAGAGLDIEPGEYVLLSVTDSGVGMDSALRERIFEPFFTTKEHGRGLGLPMAYGIVRGHRGAIHVYSEVGEGTTFKVYLPAHQEAPRLSPTLEDSAPGGCEMVLVVDDDAAVRKVLRRMLEKAGYRVLLAPDGAQGVQLYRDRSADIALVILDIIMPGMGGQEVYRCLQEVNPQVRVLLSSGYTENGKAADILEAGARGFLQKPYDLGAVLRKVRQVLDA